ncbi:CBS domain-containing protein [Yinghuangia soli]|uniref:CBS domain-containing protein n=1 Tax=Yinghuangia soli TaxID=2908204 RepID=A0AA41Q2J6_9ACTN|nr:CBS domain-containing protein [Yinghuangia soli]MCF2528927.1 CBS domain-containing protein [Yinghuangia soli]
MNAHVESPPKVGEVMHGPVVSVAADDSLWTAMDVMLGRGLRHLAVVRGETVQGVLADRELAAVWAMNPLGLKNVRAADALAPNQTFIGPEVDVVAAALRMRAAGADAFVVVDEARRPLGIVTDHDLLGVLAGLLGGEGEGVGAPAPRYHGAGHPTLLPD